MLAALCKPRTLQAVRVRIPVVRVLIPVFMGRVANLAF